MIIELPVQDLIPAGFIDAFGPEAIQAVLADIANSARNHWDKLAEKQLQTSRAQYRESIQEVEMLPGMAVVTLLGQPANTIENGSEMVDLRDWLLGPRVKVAPFGQRGKRQAADGSFYRAVPFRHQTPGTIGLHGAPMGDPYKDAVDDSEELGRLVYEKALELTGSVVEDPGDEDRTPTTKWGGRLSEGAVEGLGLLKDHHTTDIYSGMVRTEAAYDVSTQTGGFMTFRTISTKKTVGWIRPSTPGVHLAHQVRDFTARLAPAAFASYVRGITGG